MTHFSKQPIYILGAGPAGLAAAYALTQLGQPVVVVERDSQVGGLARSIYYQGFILDYGPHRFFTKLAPVLRLWNEILGPDQVTVDRLTRIYYNGQYFSYPIKLLEVLRTLGLFESSRIVLSYLAARLKPHPQPQNFAEWVSSRFGQRLFAIFFEAYTEKLWGIPCREISATWAAQRIKGLSLFKAIRTALLGNDGQVKTLIDQFQFPRQGSGQLYEKLSAFLQEQGQTILLNTEVVRLDTQDHQVQQVALKNRHTGEVTTVSCGGIISSIPISHLVEQLSPHCPPSVRQAARSLRFRNTILVYLIVDGNHLFPDNWLYINEADVGIGRVTNFANWSPAMLPNDRQTPLCCEYWCNFEDALWQAPDDQLLQRAERELRQLRLLRHETVSSGFVVRLPRTYPIYSGNYQENLAQIQGYLARFTNLQLVGRYGSFKYNNQDHSLLMGILAAENVVSPGKHDLWAVNSDSEYGEEAKVDRVTTTARSHRRSRRWQTVQMLQRFSTYLLTGGTATLLDALVFTLLIRLGLWYVAALCVSYALGLTTNFWLSRQFVFKVYWKNAWYQYAVFATVALNSLLANLGLLQLLIGDFRWQPTQARLFSAACVAILSFVGHSLYSFGLNSEAVDREAS